MCMFKIGFYCGVHIFFPFATTFLPRYATHNVEAEEKGKERAPKGWWCYCCHPLCQPTAWNGPWHYYCTYIRTLPLLYVLRTYWSGLQKWHQPVSAVSKEKEGDTFWVSVWSGQVIRTVSTSAGRYLTMAATVSEARARALVRVCVREFRQRNEAVCEVVASSIPCFCRCCCFQNPGIESPPCLPCYVHRKEKEFNLVKD